MKKLLKKIFKKKSKKSKKAPYEIGKIYHGDGYTGDWETGILQSVSDTIPTTYTLLNHCGSTYEATRITLAENQDKGLYR